MNVHYEDGLGGNGVIPVKPWCSWHEVYESASGDGIHFYGYADYLTAVFENLLSMMDAPL
ncbi:MAG: hypothetical protein LBU25_01000 [Treponema sp.]|nr:hypothetical protein [Treponema sp.]